MDKKKWVKHIPLFILEFIVLVVAGCILYVTLRATDKESGAVKDNIQEEEIAVNEEVKEKIKETEETGKFYTKSNGEGANAASSSMLFPL